jgi:hypothetical protein
VFADPAVNLSSEFRHSNPLLARGIQKPNCTAASRRAGRVALRKLSGARETGLQVTCRR